MTSLKPCPPPESSGESGGESGGRVRRLLGLDPGLQHTGWGIIAVEGNRLSHIANGQVSSDSRRSLAERLVQIAAGLEEAIALWKPDDAAVETSFINRHGAASLKLGQARGICLLIPARAGLPVSEYAPNLVKKTVTGVGHAGKDQIRLMVGHLLPGCAIASEHAADALAVAVCHAHHQSSRLHGAVGA